MLKGCNQKNYAQIHAGVVKMLFTHKEFERLSMEDIFTYYSDEPTDNFQAVCLFKIALMLEKRFKKCKRQ